MTVKISFNGQEIGYIAVQWIGLEDTCEDYHLESGEGYHKELYFIESSVIIHDFIEKGDPEFKDATQILFEIKDGFFRQEIRDNSGNIIKLWMIPLSYLFNIECRKDEPSREEEQKINRLNVNVKKSLK
jgi:hypothetical protein